MVKFGNFLQVNETRPDPKVTWDAVDTERYVLLMIGEYGHDVPAHIPYQFLNL